MSWSERFRISNAAGGGGTVVVKNNDRPCRATPMRLGMPASHSSSAERMELGKATPDVNFFPRSRWPTCQIFSEGENVITSSTKGCRSQSPASFSGESNVICAPGRASRNRSKAGVVMTASPSQLTLRTRMLSVAAGISTQADFADAIVKVLGPAQDFDFHAHEIDGQVAAIQLGEAH